MDPSRSSIRLENIALCAIDDDAAATAEMTGDSVVPLIVNFYAFGAKERRPRSKPLTSARKYTDASNHRPGNWSRM